jgi:hypothetical protein
MDGRLRLFFFRTPSLPRLLDQIIPDLPNTHPFDGFFALQLRQLRLPAELDATGHGALAAVARAFADEVALEFGDCS